MKRIRLPEFRFDILSQQLPPCTVLLKRQNLNENATTNLAECLVSSLNILEQQTKNAILELGLIELFYGDAQLFPKNDTLSP